MQGVSRRWLALTFAVGAGLLAAACGGGEATSTPVPPTATRVPPTPTAAPATPTATTAGAGPTATSAAPAATATRPPSATATAAPRATPAPNPTPTRPPATPTATGPKAKRGGLFRMRVSNVGFLNNHDIYQPGTPEFSTITAQNMLSHLTVLDAVDGATIRPELADGFTFSPDGKTMVFNLKRGVRWHDGTPFTAKDALYSLDRAKNPKDAKAVLHVARLRILSNMEAPDDYTLKLTLSAPNAAMPTLMSINTMLIFPSHIPDVTGKWQASPVGTGPFKWKEYKQDSSMDLVRNDAYFKKDAGGQALPYLDGVRYILIADRALTLSAFRAGQLDCACGFSSDIFPEDRDATAKAIPNVKFGVALTTMNYLQVNSRPPLNNQKVRQAISIALDRATAQQVYANGTGSYPATYFVSDKNGGKFSLTTDELLKTPGFRVKDGKKDPADLDLAKKLMSESGVDASKVNLVFITSGGTLQVLSELTGQLLTDAGKALGMTVKVSVLTGAQQVDVLRRGDFDLYNQPGPNSFDDPLDVIIPRNTTGGTLNYGKFSFPRIDQLANDQQAELDPNKRAELVKQLQRELLDQAIFVPINHMAPLFAEAPYVEGYALNRAYNVTTGHNLETTWLNK